MSTTVRIPTFGTITDENLSDLRTTAWYGGIDYWAGDPRSEAPEGTILSLRDLMGERDYFLNHKNLVDAFVAITHTNTTKSGGSSLMASYIFEYFMGAWNDRTDEGIDMGYIDADAADVWVQIACFGEIVYG